MPLSRDYYLALQVRAKTDSRLRTALLTRALNAYLSGNYKAGKGLLRQLIHATIGFEPLGKLLNKSGKSIHRMFGPQGNPNTGNLFAVLSVLQKDNDVRLIAKITKIPPDNKSRISRECR